MATPPKVLVDLAQKYEEQWSLPALSVIDFLIDYMDNIQVNAAMAVIWWKKWSGVYVSSKPTFWMLIDTYLDGLYTDHA